MRKFARNGLAVVGTAVVVYYALVGLYKLRPLAEDEAPIRVRNGSLDILVGTSEDAGKKWRWKRKEGDDRDSSPSYSHEPDQGGRDEDIGLWVKVVPKNGAQPRCDDNSLRFEGEIVMVKYTSGNSTYVAKIRRGNKNILGNHYRTRVRLPNDFTLVDDGTLRHGETGAGYISQVRSENGACSFQSAQELEEILICSSARNTKCQ